MQQERHDFNHHFRYSKPKIKSSTTSVAASAESQRQLCIRREIEWRQECKAAEIDFGLSLYNFIDDTEAKTKW